MWNIHCDVLIGWSYWVILLWAQNPLFTQWMHTNLKVWLYSSILRWNKPKQHGGKHFWTFSWNLLSHITTVFRLRLWRGDLPTQDWLHPCLQPMSELHVWQLHRALSPSALSINQLCLLPSHGPSRTVLSHHVSQWVQCVQIDKTSF